MAYDESLKSITLDADSSVGIYTGVPGQPGSADPNGAKQYYFVKITGANTCGLADGNTTQVAGVLQNKPQATGAAATVAISGVSLVAAGEEMAAGAAVYVGTDGRGVDTASASAVKVGVALQASTAAGQLIPVLLKV